MSRQTRQLDQMARIARARADLELRRYAACRAQADAMRQQVETARSELAAAMTVPGPDAMDHWRLATALVGYRAGQLHRAEDALTRIQPALESARGAAARAFGRAEAIAQLRRLKAAQERIDRLRRSE